MRASAAIPSLFTPVMQGNRMLVDGGLLNPLPIVPVVSAHCDMIIAVNLNANNHKQYPLPEIERPGRFDTIMSSISSHLPFWRKEETALAELDDIRAGELLRGDSHRRRQPAAVHRNPLKVQRWSTYRAGLAAGADQPEFRRHAVIAGAVQDRRLPAQRAGQHPQARLSLLRVLQGARADRPRAHRRS